MWLLLAVGSSVFAALTSILAKVGVEGVNSHLATAIRTLVVLVMAWGMVFLTGAQEGVGQALGGGGALIPKEGQQLVLVPKSIGHAVAEQDQGISVPQGEGMLHGHHMLQYAQGQRRALDGFDLLPLDQQGLAGP